jgi:hypothetical protein
MGSNGLPPKQKGDIPTSIPPPKKSGVNKKVKLDVSPEPHDELLTFLIVTDILIGENDVNRKN